MSRLFAFLVIMVLCVVGIGFYRSWFTVTSPSSDTESNKVNFSLTVDPDKVKADAEAVKEKAAELTGQAADGADEQAADGANEQTVDGADEPVDSATDKVKPDDE